MMRFAEIKVLYRIVLIHNKSIQDLLIVYDKRAELWYAIWAVVEQVKLFTNYSGGYLILRSRNNRPQLKKRMVSKWPTSEPRSLDLNLDTKSCVVTGATARRTLLISSSVTGDMFVPLFDEAEIFDAGFAEDDASSLRPDAFVSYTARNYYLHTDKT